MSHPIPAADAPPRSRINRTAPRLKAGAFRMAPVVPAVPVTHAFTVDVEDWPIAVLGPNHAVTGRVVENTRRLLEILRWHNVRGTFFVLTKVAERFPELIREAHAAGHEIASHGHSHELLTQLTPERFRDDVLRSVDILTEIIGARPIGYRAPAFSIVEETRWAGPILAESGFIYSSSIFPIHHRRYGIPDAPLNIHRWPECELLECPPAALSWFWRNWPVAGGGYFRLLPGSVARAAIRTIGRAGRPAILYMHPYELDVGGVARHVAEGVQVGRLRRYTQAMFRSHTERRLHRLFESFAFAPLIDLLSRQAPIVESVPAPEE